MVIASTSDRYSSDTMSQRDIPQRHLSYALYVVELPWDTGEILQDQNLNLIRKKRRAELGNLGPAPTYPLPSSHHAIS